MAGDKRQEVTAYSLYSKQAKKRTKINPLEDIYPKLPNKKYQVIVGAGRNPPILECVNRLW